MYKKIVLEKFERHELCQLTLYQFEDVKEWIEYTIGVLNEGIEEGRKILKHLI